jgi:protoporphyrin/coproporphyrin ferrochelatase
MLSSVNSSSGQNIGILLTNLGTPDSPATSDVRRYLREFLSDRRVLDVNPVVSWLLRNLIILPFRPRKSAAAYRAIWTPEGSPLLAFSRRLCDGVARELGSGFSVELGMRYGSPPIGEALERLRQAGAESIVALPLYPQYSAATTGSSLARIYELAATHWDVPAIHALGAFWDQPRFIEAYADGARGPMAEFGADHVLFSYHGLPEHQLLKSDPSSHGHCLTRDDCCSSLGPINRGCYRAQCFATTRALATALELPAQRWSVSFQSRLGRTPWIQPYTDRVLPELAGSGINRLAVLCPAFATDCLETLEEIGIRLRRQWQDLGGDAFLLAPCPNASPPWVRAVADMVREAAAAESPRT